MNIDDPSTVMMNGARMDITPALVRRLVAAQFPQWAHLPVRPVAFSGWDNHTFHLGKQMSVRLPSAERYVLQVEKEHTWLPKLAPSLPLPIPTPLAMGMPGANYPWRWSIFQWLAGDSAAGGQIADLRQFALRLAEFLAALQRIDANGGPPAGAHNFFRGGLLTVYDSETRETIAALDGDVDGAAATEVWEAALQSTWQGPPVWVHGDVSAGNLLVDEQGRLCAVIDFGSSGVGDPACDLTIAWTLFAGESREAFRTALLLDDATWARSRGWALWKALITLRDTIENEPVKAQAARLVIAEVLAEHQRSGAAE